MCPGTTRARRGSRRPGAAPAPPGRSPGHLLGPRVDDRDELGLPGADVAEGLLPLDPPARVHPPDVERAEGDAAELAVGARTVVEVVELHAELRGDRGHLGDPGVVVIAEHAVAEVRVWRQRHVRVLLVEVGQLAQPGDQVGATAVGAGARVAGRSTVDAMAGRGIPFDVVTRRAAGGVRWGRLLRGRGRVVVLDAHASDVRPVRVVPDGGVVDFLDRVAAAAGWSELVHHATAGTAGAATASTMTEARPARTRPVVRTAWAKSSASCTVAAVPTTSTSSMR